MRRTILGLTVAALIAGPVAAHAAGGRRAMPAGKGAPTRVVPLTPGAWKAIDYSPTLDPRMALKYQSSIVCITAESLRENVIPIMPMAQAKACKRSSRVDQGLRTLIAECPNGLHVLRPDYLAPDVFIGMYLFKGAGPEGLDFNAGLEMQKLAADCPTAPAPQVHFAPALPPPFGMLETALDAIAAHAVAPVPLYRLLQAGLRGVFEDEKLPVPIREAFSKAATAVAEAADDRGRLAAFAEIFRKLPAASHKDAIVTAALRAMVGEVDPRGGFLEWQPSPDYPPDAGSIGVEITTLLGNDPVVTRAFPDSPAARAGIRVGDAIVAIDNVLVAGMGAPTVQQLLRGPVDAPAKVTLRRAGAPGPLDLEIPRAAIAAPPMRVALLDGRIGYMRPEAFGLTSEADLAKGLERLKARAGGRLDGLVLDLRDNSGGLFPAATSFAGDLLAAGTPVVSVRGRTPDDSRSIAATGDRAAGVPIAVVVDERTVAGAEIVAAALQDARRAFVVGSRTAGDGAVRGTFDLGDTSGVLRLATGTVSRPSGCSLDGGVTPDIPVYPGDATIAGRLRKVDGALALAAGEKPERPDLAAITPRIAAHPPAGEADAARPDADFEVRQAAKALELPRGAQP